MKSTTPHDPFDDLMVAALHGELTPEEQTAFEARLQTDPAARAAYQEMQAMHDLLEKTHREAQPDAAFEQRMIAKVRRELQHDKQHRETPWESAVLLWNFAIGVLRNRWVVRAGYACAVLLVLAIGTEAYQHAQNQLAREAVAKNVSSQDLMRGKALASTDVDANTTSPASSPSVPAEPAPPLAESMPMATTSADTSVAMEEQAKTQMTVASADDEATHRAVMAPQATDKLAAIMTPSDAPAPLPGGTGGAQSAGSPATASTAPANAPAVIDARKLIRNAQLDLEVKSYQPAIDQIAAMTKAAGGYVDTSNSQRGGNGKLQGNVVVKVLPQNLDGFLLKLRDLGEVRNQSVSTEDVTKDYYDTQARLENSRRMETQLQELLKHDNGKVADLLQVERELGRVRGDIEQMQGELKLYDFQVQYATVSLSVKEKDLHAAAAYLLKERDEFSLVSTNVESTFQQARQAADDFKANILTADLSHNSGTDISATLLVAVPPEQIDAFLAKIRSLSRVANFTRQTERVARDGGDTDEPADETLTEKDRVLVNVSIRSDDDAHKQVTMTVVTPTIDDAFDKVKTAALASAGTEILSSSLNKTADGQSSATIGVRVPGRNYPALLAAFRGLGRTSSFSLQREDNSGPNATGDDEPVTITLTLTDDETPLQQTEMSVVSTDIDAKAQQLKQDAAAAKVEVKASSFERDPDGTETAQMTFWLPLSGYAGFVDKLKSLGRVETLSVHRDDRPDQAQVDEGAPAEIKLDLHNQGPIVADDNGIWATLRRTCGDGAAALFSSVRMIGVITAFITPWVMVLGLLAWAGRRIYVRRTPAK